MANPTNETGQVKAIRLAILEAYPDAYVLKIHGGMYQEAGIPDLMVVVDGRIIGMEVKHQRPGESRAHAISRVSDVQWAHIHRLQKAGAVAHYVLNPGEALALIASALKGNHA